MKKKNYLMPTIEILEFEHEAELLAGTTFDPDAPQEEEILHPGEGDEVTPILFP